MFLIIEDLLDVKYVVDRFVSRCFHSDIATTSEPEDIANEPLCTPSQAIEA
jgi:hypothetical protein